MTRRNATEPAASASAIPETARAPNNAPTARIDALPCDIPPWRYQRPGVPPVLAALLAAADLGLGDLDRLVLLWKLRRQQPDRAEPGTST